MIDSSGRKIFEYVADIQSVEKNLQRMEDLNKKIARSVGQEFGNVAKVISSNFQKTADIKIFDKDGAEKIVKVLDQTNTIVKTTSGHFFKLSEASTATNDTQTKLVTTISDVTKQYTNLNDINKKLYGQSSQLKTNFSNLNDINQKFANNLKGLGGVSSVVKRDLHSISDNGVKLGYVVKTTNGKFIQLSETIKRTPEGYKRYHAVLRILQNNIKNK